eukprot:TRINITY_DN451_c0_g1_i1.p1 TRINITY_DN451_c0_g1~~TRINITY_DN451_c0_g1_i1.p1  ORF type:complete len:595 (-),score=204.43 TRINITY_DN451_c0_g1_i1:44-1828(-)
MGKREKDKKAAAKKAATTKKDAPSKAVNEDGSGEDEYVEEKPKYEESPRSVTGSLASQYLSRDLKIENFSLGLYGQVLVTDTRLEFNWGRRYGLLGFNGSGKSTLLTCIGKREIPVPDHFNIFHLDREAEASEKTALEWVLSDLDKEKSKLEAEADRLSATEEGAGSERLVDIYSALDELDVETAPKRAGEILFGLGFSKDMQDKKTKDFSGGWRMRIALAKALFVRPNMLLLDEPTNHLDLEACVWLEEYLKKYQRILVIISHSQDFLNNVCTNIILLQNQKLIYYSGNYDSYVKSRAEKEENQMKQYQWEQDQIAHMKEYIARFGHGSAKLARQAQSKEKTLEKMKEKGLTEKVVADKVLSLRFLECDRLPPPVMAFNTVSFGYNSAEKGYLYKDVEFGVDMDSRIALVGPNGVGKSTLLKLMVGEITPTQGTVRRHNHLRLGWYHQHLTDQLDVDLSPLEYMMKEFPGIELQVMRSVVGRYGITGKTQVLPMKTLSDGQKSRVMFAWLSQKAPNLLLLDEPTNHLDMETIDALAGAINSFEGGMILVSHDFRLINQVAKEIWVCENKNVKPWKGDIMDYKKHLRAKMGITD